MALGKKMLLAGLILGVCIPGAHAQQKVSAIEPTSSSAGGETGWAVDRPAKSAVYETVPNQQPVESSNKSSSVHWNWKLFPFLSKKPDNRQSNKTVSSKKQVTAQVEVPNLKTSATFAGNLGSPSANAIAENKRLVTSEVQPTTNSFKNQFNETPLQDQGFQQVASFEKTGNPNQTVVTRSNPSQLGAPKVAASPYVPVHFANPSGISQVGYQVVEQDNKTQSENDQPILKGVPLPPIGSTQVNENHLPVQSMATTVKTGQGLGSPLVSRESGINWNQPIGNPGVVVNLKEVSSTDGSLSNSGGIVRVGSQTPEAPLQNLGTYSNVPTSNLDDGQSIFTNQQGWVNPQRSNFYARGEYLLWWIKNDPIPPLVTTGPAIFGPNGSPDGATLDRPDTTVLFGGNGLSRGAFSGVRLTAGWWCDWNNSEGIEFSGFVLPQNSRNYTANSTQYPQISRPFTDQITGSQSAQDTTFPGLAVGSINIHAPASLWGLEANMRCNLCCGDYCGNNYRLDMIGGPRYLNLAEGIEITENILFTNNPALGPFQNQRDIVNDSFFTRNQFIGGQLGLIGQYNWGRFSVEGRGKLALGDTMQTLVIQGSQTLPDQYGARNGGLLALQSNIGTYHRNAFSVVPEIGVNLGYQVSDNVRALVGYNFLAWTNVLRPGEQINTLIDSSLIPQFPPVPKGSGVEPSVPFKDSTFWAQGITLGLEIRY